MRAGELLNLDSSFEYSVNNKVVGYRVPFSRVSERVLMVNLQKCTKLSTMRAAGSPTTMLYLYEDITIEVVLFQTYATVREL